MTKIQRDLEQMLDYMLFPTRFAKAYNNTGGVSYPPYNIVKVSDDSLILEVAVAGFNEDEITVLVEDGYLKISGKKSAETNVEYLYKGIGTRSFERSFALSKDAIVESASFEAGILSVLVKEQVPEEKKPRQIPIKKSEKTFLAG